MADQTPAPEKPDTATEPNADSVQVVVNWHVPETIVGRYATNFVVQHGAHEVFLYFFEIRPPLVIGEPEQVREQYEAIGSVQAECVGLITIAKDRLPEYIDVLQRIVQLTRVEAKPEKSTNGLERTHGD